MKMKMLALIAAVLAIPELALAQVLAPAVGINSGSASSWLAGAQAGYNWQSGSVVYGLEADISGMDLKTSMNTVLKGGFSLLPPTANTNSTIDWYGTVRGRLGWATGPVMIYGTGGLAYGRVGVNSTLFDTDSLTAFNLQSSWVRTGWVAGFGIEYLWRPNLILNLGYQYVDLGTTSLAATPNPFISQSVNASGRFQTVSVGLSWLFPAVGPVAVGRTMPTKAPPQLVLAPWQGLYVGGHAGGAWGNRTDASYSDLSIPGSDIRLKRDIVLVGRRSDGLGLYSYRYLWSETVYVGVMAQEVALIHPDAIVRAPLDDYLRVNYRRLGTRLLTFPEWEAMNNSL